MWEFMRVEGRVRWVSTYIFLKNIFFLVSYDVFKCHILTASSYVMMSLVGRHINVGVKGVQECACSSHISTFRLVH